MLIFLLTKSRSMKSKNTTSYYKCYHIYIIVLQLYFYLHNYSPILYLFLLQLFILLLINFLLHIQQQHWLLALLIFVDYSRMYEMVTFDGICVSVVCSNWRIYPVLSGAEDGLFRNDSPSDSLELEESGGPEPLSCLSRKVLLHFIFMHILEYGSLLIFTLVVFGPIRINAL